MKIEARGPGEWIVELFRAGGVRTGRYFFGAGCLTDSEACAKRFEGARAARETAQAAGQVTNAYWRARIRHV